MSRRRADPGAGTGPILGADELARFTLGVMADLDRLRRGEISLEDARARAKLAHEALRGVGLLLAAQRFLSSRAREVAALAAGTPAAPPYPDADPGIPR